MRYYEKIEADALARNIPVMQREGLELMIEIFKHHNCHCCLEIGSAIGPTGNPSYLYVLYLESTDK